MRRISMQEATKTLTAMPTICPVLKEDGSVVAMASVVAKAAAVIPLVLPFSLALRTASTSTLELVQTSQNRSRMSEATPPLPPLPPLPHCVAVGKYRQKV